MSISISNEQVRLIFRETYSLYQKYKEFPLFLEMMRNLPDAENGNVSDIMRDTYNLFVKYQNVYLDEDWCELCKEAKQLNQEYKDSELAHYVLLEILNILEKRYTNKGRKR